jgi:WD40 repeat protein
VNLWDTSEPAHPRPLPSITGHTAEVRAVGFAPDGETIATGSFDGSLKLWNLRLGQCVATLRRHSSVIGALVWSPDGNTIYTGGGEGVICIWNAPTQAE